MVAGLRIYVKGNTHRQATGGLVRFLFQQKILFPGYTSLKPATEGGWARGRAAHGDGGCKSRLACFYRFWLPARVMSEYPYPVNHVNPVLVVCVSLQLNSALALSRGTALRSKEGRRGFYTMKASSLDFRVKDPCIAVRASPSVSSVALW
jgi:hypothetical protein